MSTRSNSSHLFSPLRDPESLIRRRNLGELSSLFDFEEVMNNNQNQEQPPQNGPPPMDTSAVRGETSRNISSASTTKSSEVVRQLEMMNKNFSDTTRQFQTIKAVDTKCETCGGPHSFTECPAVGGYTQETVYAITGNYNSGGTGSLPSNTVPNPREDLKAITTRSGVTLAGPSVSPSSSSEVNREPETITDEVLTGSTNNVPPLVVQPSFVSTSFSNNSSSKMLEVTKDTVQPSTENIQPPVAQKQNPIYELVVAPKPKPTIPYPSRVNKQKLREKDDNLGFNLLNNKENLFDIATTPVNENCSAVILKKLPKKLGDPDKFLIPCDFPEFDECLALADLGVSINLMPLSIWKKLSLPELTSTQMILELADRSMTRPAGIAEDVFVKVGKFYFPTDFVVVNYVVDPRVPLILGRPFLRTGRALIDVYSEELTLHVDDEAVTFKVGQTSKYSYNDAMLINRIDVIDIDCEEYVQEVLGFFDNSKSGNPTPTFDLIANSDFILEEIEACLTSESILPGIDDTGLDLEGDIRLLEELLNNDLSLSSLPLKELNVEEIKTGSDKLPVIIAKDLKDDEKETLLKEKTTFTCSYGTFPYRRMPFGLCNAPGTFQRSFLGHVGFYRRFIQDFFKIARPMTHLLEKETSFMFSKDCIDAFETLKKKLTEASILVVPDWNLPFELMCDASDFATGAALGQHTHWCTPYKLVYGKSCHLPIELENNAYWALKHANFDLKTTGDHRKLQLNELNELRDQAYENSLLYKEKTRKLHDSKIKNRIFNVGDRVLLFNSRLKIFSGKLKTRWSGPFTIAHVFPYRTIDLSQPDGPNFKVNGHCVKHYFKGDIPQLVFPDL
uniref:Reverse transcriptase domain-containing protein n=1 Tax=Tanacetum cinerariifolium TaxID=118510 RepID=A0A6L2MJZ3_TANCI|nr:reverse transcriptase domain-containing protein [Tanacetum cinerariifolium]